MEIRDRLEESKTDQECQHQRFLLRFVDTTENLGLVGIDGHSSVGPRDLCEHPTLGHGNQSDSGVTDSKLS